MMTLISLDDLFSVAKYLDDLSVWVETDSTLGSTRRVRITHQGETALGESVGSVVQFSSYSRANTWSICARVGIPFTFA